jgi:hypothetical protein
MSPDDERSEADLVAGEVDRHVWGPSEEDEETVLEALYGPPDANGVYRGEGTA